MSSQKKLQPQTRTVRQRRQQTLASAQKAAKRQARQGQGPRPQPKQPIVTFETRKQAKADPRVGGQEKMADLTLANQIRVLTQPVDIPQACVEDWARGFVNRALERGFMNAAELSTYPYMAYAYIVSTMRALIANEIQQSINVPYSMLAMCQALQTTTVPFSNGSICYSTQVSAFTDPTVLKTIGYAPYGYAWNCGFPQATLVNLLYPVSYTTTPTYDPELGARAFQQMVTFLIDDRSKGPNRMVPVSLKTPLKNDVSAFAFTRTSQEVIGLASQGVGRGGMVQTANLEVPIFRPAFAGINCSSPNAFTDVENNRFGQLHAEVVGDGTFLAAAQATWFTEDKWRAQRPPKLHFVDFNEFGDVVARWVAGMQQAYVNETVNTSSPTFNPASIQCTLTLQNMLILLRNVMMTAFKQSQACVHSLYPIVPASDTDSQFVPFVVSSSTCFLTAIDMSLPVPIVENIRALVMRYCHRGGSDWEFFLPVLGIINGKSLNEANYYYTYNSVNYPSFLSSAALSMKKINDVGKTRFEPLVETPISLVDGSSSAGYAFINDPEALKKNAGYWEAWFTTSGVSPYSVAVGPLGTELGVNILSSVTMSRICDNSEITRKRFSDRAKVNADLVDIRVYKGLTTLPLSDPFYATVEIVLDSSQSKILSTAYEQVQSVWILPTIYDQIDDLNIITPLRWQAIMGESFSSNKKSGASTVGYTLDDLHQTYANKCLRNKLQQPNEWEQLFTELSRTGRGGELTDIVAKFADGLFPGAAPIVKTIGGIFGL